MSTTNPTTQVYTPVISAQALARGTTVRGTLDLSGKYGAWLYVAVGRGGTSALDIPANVEVRPYYNDGTNDIPHPNSSLSRTTGTIAAAATTCATSDSAAGQQALNVASVTGFASGDIICIQDAAGTVTRLEFAKVSKTATGVLTLNRNLVYTHTSAGADSVRNRSDVFSRIWLAGDAKYEVIFDYGAATVGDSMTVWARADVYPSDTTA